MGNMTRWDDPELQGAGLQCNPGCLNATFYISAQPYHHPACRSDFCYLRYRRKRGYHRDGRGMGCNLSPPYITSVYSSAADDVLFGNERRVQAKNRQRASHRLEGNVP